ncbi:lactate dehydrogenase [Dissulfurispira thermophila]|uniref:Lactate dehydrogenase n=1 Tax=Dissulfurispira thermophila TaxID=2715679 RepID=A0A7G1H3P5_9BACT|nr:FAD-linked oxidase C-terminal domain-containing protein [Dissulfurispira thermophila]BCB97430.1 lactate dehydrogenase [Dissulfurispira thermophila]
MKNSLLSGIQISTDKEDLICYSFDASIAESALPEAVAWPKNTNEVIRLIKYANENNLSIIPRGAGTGMAGASVPSANCIVLSFEKMRKILDVDTKNMTVVVEPGIVNRRLQKEMEYLGYFYPPDPASMNICTIGGNVATNAGGPRALKYGVTRNYIMEIEAAIADGKLITTGGRTYKKAVGYDLRNLLIGSEGTLAISTKICLKILPLPEDIMTLLVFFKNIEASGIAISKIISAKIIPRTMEFMDRFAIEAIENYKPTGLPLDIAALLLIELDGYPATIKKEAERIVDICHSLGGEATVAEDDMARERLWEARRSISPALYHIKPTKINEDIVVPRDKIPLILTELQRISEETRIKIISFGHAGDGNIHVNVMVDRDNKEEYAKGWEIIKKIFEITLKLGGSISGEHGIGITKAPYINMEIKEKELELMKGIKGIFDPRGIMNPGKILG